MHYLYLTIDLTNAMWYIGIHTSEHINSDSYLGSGNKIKLAIKEKGRENFHRFILKVYDTRKEAELDEKTILTAIDAAANPSSYNGTNKNLGGRNENAIRASRGRKHTDEAKQRMSANNKRHFLNKKHDEVAKLKMSKNHWDCSGKNNPSATKVLYQGKEFDTINELASYLGVHRRTVRNMIKNNKVTRLEN